MAIEIKSLVPGALHLTNLVGDNQQLAMGLRETGIHVLVRENNSLIIHGIPTDPKVSMLKIFWLRLLG